MSFSREVSNAIITNLRKEPGEFWSLCPHEGEGIFQREGITIIKTKFPINIKDEKVSKIAKGDLVLVQEEKMKRSCWKTGVIEELIKGRDEVVRGAKVRRAGSKNETINRSVLKLIPLEIACSGYDKKEEKVECDGNKKQVSIERSEGTNNNSIEDAVCFRNQPPRAAAKDSRWMSKIMLDA